MAKTFWSGGVAKKFLLPHPSNVCLYDCPLHHNSMSLINFQHLCVIFLRVNIYASLPNDLKIWIKYEIQIFHVKNIPFCTKYLGFSLVQNLEIFLWLWLNGSSVSFKLYFTEMAAGIIFRFGQGKCTLRTAHLMFIEKESFAPLYLIVKVFFLGSGGRYDSTSGNHYQKSN